MITCQEIGGSTREAVQLVINRIDAENTTAAESIIAVAKCVEEAGGAIPSTHDGILEIPTMDSRVASQLMTIFGSTELAVGLHTRKLVVALDMFDWEETGVEHKTDVKMASVPAERVKKSLTTWMPFGERRASQEMLESVGNVIGSDRIGFYGKLKACIGKHFNPTDKKELLEMTDSIVQFYKTTKGGKRKPPSCS